MKHTRKRILGILAAIALSFCSLPQNMPLNPLRPAITASAAETSGTCGENLTWAYNKSTKTLTISGTGNMDDYDACLSLEPAGFYNPNKHRPSYYVDGDITKVVIEDGVNGIGAYAFYFQSVTEISIPDSVTTLSKSSFCGCDELTEITLPDSIYQLASSNISPSTMRTVRCAHFATFRSCVIITMVLPISCSFVNSRSTSVPLL